MNSLWKLGGMSWMDLAKRIYQEIWDDDVLGSAAQLAYYFIFALFPLLIFLTSIFGFLVGSDAELRNDLFKYLGTVLPGSATDLINSVIQEVSASSTGGKLTFGLFLTLWAASSGMEALNQALNKTYNTEETRPWWKRRLLALFLTVTLALLIITALIIVLFGGHIANWVASTYGYGDVFLTVWAIAQWIIVLGSVLLSFSLIYYFSPDVHDQKWYWITPGSFIGVALWLLVSFGFRLYLQYFDSYSATYGSLGAVIVLMLWLYFSGIAILVGGEINSEIENAAAKAGAPDAKDKGEKAPDGKPSSDANETASTNTSASSESNNNEAKKLLTVEK